MITQEVTAAELAAWKQLWEEHAAAMCENRIDGTALDAYFRESYHPDAVAPDVFRDVVFRNAQEQTPEPDIAVYTLPGGVWVGIDRVSGYFHVECEYMAKAVPVWDDLFLHRGLDRQDLANYVVTGQYLQLQQHRGEI
ncbi:MAG: hypothetical protein K5695_00545 [Oscillospiraceae bacterium]|nr:hypothetical protein [Oscillospiraceae bacterium]